jgi:hypothetical protein
VITGTPFENLKHFPKKELGKYGITAERADTFVLGLVDLNPRAALDAIRKQWHNLKNPPHTREEFLDNLEHAGLVQTVAAIRPYL